MGQCGKIQSSKKPGVDEFEFQGSELVYEELARRFNYDIKAIGEALRRQQKASGRMPITRLPKRVKPTAA